MMGMKQPCKTPGESVPVENSARIKALRRNKLAGPAWLERGAGNVREVGWVTV